MVAVTLVIFGYGVYLIYSCIQMKNTGEIPKMMINNKINLERAKDIPGYINYMYVRTIVFGIIICIISAILIAAEYVTFDPLFLIIVQFLYFAIIILYTVRTVKAQNKFLS